MKFFLSAFLVVFLAVFGLPSLSLAAPIIYTANLDGPSEDPPVPSNGTGFARVTIDTVADTLRVEVDFSDLVGDTTVAHIHAPTAVPFAGNVGVATTTPTFPGFPAGVTSGTYDQTFDTSLDSTYNAPFLAANGRDCGRRRSGTCRGPGPGQGLFERAYDF